jgi:N6-adenosine-specific RNA methylase IME4
MSEETDLILRRICEAEAALAFVTNAADAADIADMAEAARVYARRAGAALPVINRATAIKLYAERKAGEILAGMEKAKNRHSSGSGVTPLGELGISKTQSSRWQRIAKVPEPVFEDYIASADVLDRELSTSAVLKLANIHAPKNGAKPAERHTGICTDLQDLISTGMKFGTIYADPPWRYQNQGTRASTDNHYAGDMSVEEICAMPISQLTEEKAHLHLWTTNAFLFDCKSIMEAWGFEFKSSFVWVKPSFGIGNYWRNSHEIMLLGVKGGQTAISRSEKSWTLCKRGSHSAKPEYVRHSIERLSPGPYLELFGRAPKQGWTVYGNQIVEELITL